MMNLSQLNIILLACMPFVLFGQHEGDKWVIGYDSPGTDPDFSIMHIDFEESQPRIEYHFDEILNLRSTISNICDKDGTAILWTNGMQIFGKNGILVADTISFDDEDRSYWKYWYTDLYGPFGFTEADGAVVLPYPNHLNEFEVIYHTADIRNETYFSVNQFLEARVRKDDDTTYHVLFKDIPIEPKHNWYASRILTCRHANGRDWWIMTFEADSPFYYAYILDPNGIRIDHKGEISQSIREGLGQGSISNFGNYIARTDAVYPEAVQHITLFSFDRCIGEINFLALFQIHVGGFEGVAFSPSEQYLYADDRDSLWQWDLWSTDIAASKKLVGIHDGFIEPGWYEPKFGPMKLAQDGRIYITASGNSSKRLHVIDRPDEPAPNCRLLQHFINLENWNGRSIPNIPNYRLGPLDGSPCDTLGLNNLPVAKWRYEEDLPGDNFQIRFTDQSYFDPHAWLWNFDDGNMSTTPSPLHTFDPGLYHICLTVSNDYATDSMCRWVEILPTDVRDQRIQNSSAITILPNPFSNQLTIQTSTAEYTEVQLQLYDINGKSVLNRSSVLIPCKMTLPDLPPGVYLCILRDKEKVLANIKLMKID